MAITDTTELQTAIGNWLNRSDLAGVIPDFVALAEAKIRRRLRWTSARATATLSADVAPLPAACAELRSIRLVTGTPSADVPLRIVTPDVLAEKRAAYASTGRPRFASVLGGSLLLVPAPDTAYDAELVYFEALVPLSATAPTNALLSAAPDVYLYGALLQAAPYLENDERLPVWQTKFDEAIDELNLAREREEYGASLRPMRLPVVFG